MIKQILENMVTTNSVPLFEAQGADYKKKMVEIFNKAVKDELGASISYKAMSEKVFGAGNNKLREELAQHGAEEYEHFNELIAYAATHGILESLNIDIDEAVISGAPSDIKGMIKFSQDLELKAVKDYREASAYALENGDIETHEFFADLASDEETHFDDVAVYTGKTREFGAY